MQPRKVILCVDRFDARDGAIWAVRSGRTWLNARIVNVEIQMETVFKGPHARQPKAYLTGIGVVRTDGHGIVTIAEG